MKSTPRFRFPAESRLKDPISVLRSVNQIFITKLKAERRDEKVTVYRIVKKMFDGDGVKSVSGCYLCV
jgi:hypothetical protein